MQHYYFHATDVLREQWWLGDETYLIL